MDIESVGEEWQEPFGEWGKRRDASSRTEFLLSMIEDSMSPGRWIELIATEPIDEVPLVTVIADKARAQTRADARDPLLRLLRTLQPASPDAQRLLADLIIWLLQQDTKVDFQNARLVLPALGANHGAKTRLTSAFRGALAAGYELKRPDLESLRRAGIDLPGSKLPDRLRKVWKDLWK